MIESGQQLGPGLSVFASFVGSSTSAQNTGLRYLDGRDLFAYSDELYANCPRDTVTFSCPGLTFTNIVVWTVTNDLNLVVSHFSFPGQFLYLDIVTLLVTSRISK